MNQFTECMATQLCVQTHESDVCTHKEKYLMSWWAIKLHM